MRTETKKFYVMGLRTDDWVELFKSDSEIEAIREAEFIWNEASDLSCMQVETEDNVIIKMFFKEVKEIDSGISDVNIFEHEDGTYHACKE